MIIGMNLTFGPMHIIGLQGQPRRMYVWTEARAGNGFFNLGFWNLVATIGAFILAVGVLLFVINIVAHPPQRPGAPLDPWDARTLEWMTTSPPQGAQLRRRARVHALDEFFHRKYEDVGEGDAPRLRQVATAEEIVAELQAAHADRHIHMPSPSYWPIVVAAALPVIAYGVIYHPLIVDRRSRHPRHGAVRLGARTVGGARVRLRAPGRRTRMSAPRWRPSAE